MPEKSPSEMLKNKVSECMEILESSQSSESLKNVMLRSFIEKIIFVRPAGAIEI